MFREAPTQAMENTDQNVTINTVPVPQDLSSSQVMQFKISVLLHQRPPQRSQQAQQQQSQQPQQPEQPEQPEQPHPQQAQQLPAQPIPQPEPGQPERVNFAQFLQFLQLIHQLRSSQAQTQQQHPPQAQPQAQPQSQPLPPPQSQNQHQPQAQNQAHPLYQQFQLQFPHYQQLYALPQQLGPDRPLHQRRFRPFNPYAHAVAPTIMIPVVPQHAYAPQPETAQPPVTQPSVPAQALTRSDTPIPLSPLTPSNEVDGEARPAKRGRLDFTQQFKEEFMALLQQSEPAANAWRAFRGARKACTIARAPCIKVYRAFCEQSGGDLQALTRTDKYENLGSMTKCGCSST